MRATTGLGLIAIVGLFACASTPADTSNAGGGTAPAGEDPAVETDPTNPDGTPIDPTNPEAPPGPVLSGIGVTHVAVFQAVKIPVVTDGVITKTTARKAPVVAKRPGLIRVYVTPASGWKAQDVTAELRLIGEDNVKFPVIRETKRIGVTSTDEDPKSTFNLEVPGESLPLGVTFQVSLTGAGGEDVKGESDGRFPRDGAFAPLGAEVSGKLKVVLVPVKYDTDGSGRVPDMSATQVELYRKTLMSMYPASEVELKVHAPFSWTKQIAANGTGFNTILSAMHQLRQSEKAAKDVYYYGSLAPSSSFSSFCQGGCVTGLSVLVENPNTASMRASVGVGYAGKSSAGTMAHEIGHAHGREHAPCGGASGADTSYPYPGAQIGVWGYDMFAKTFISPTKGRDLMGYCPNEWISDYTYNGLFDRIATISTEKQMTTMAFTPDAVVAKPTSYRVATVTASGDLSWHPESLDLDEELTGGTVLPATFVSATGVEMMKRPSHFFRFDHLPGGLLYVPQEAMTDWKTVQVQGYATKLYR